jgi:hypothetical protein
MKTIESYGSRMVNRLDELKSLIEKGTKFNGTIYAKKQGKGIRVSVYIDGKEKLIGDIEKCDVESIKNEAAAYLSFSARINNSTEWTVNGKTIFNNLTYSEMFKKYGMDFE